MSSIPLADVPVADREDLARFILVEKHVRRDGSLPEIKAVAFLPYKHVELSVTRHRDLQADELWALGQQVADMRQLPLVGRGDLTTNVPRQQGLDVVPAEGPGKGARNHANIVGWPSEKAAQMVKALELAAAAQFVKCSQAA